MRKKSLKAAVLAAMTGVVLQCGCLSMDSWWGKIVWDGILDVGWEYVLDNNGIYDLVQDN